MSKYAVFLIVALIVPSVLFSQENKDLQERFLEAEYFLMNEDYPDALNIYLQLYQQLPDNANIAHSIGICYLNIQGKKNLAIDYLEAASKNMSAKHKEGTITQTSSTYNALYDLAKAYRINFMFDKARDAYERYAKTLFSDDRENQDFIKHEIAVCEKAKNLIDKPVQYSEENLGELFNDENANFNPVVSADGKSLAYMVKLKFYDAVMFSKMLNGKWSGPVNITPELQSDGDFYISSLSPDGKMLFLSKNDDLESDIYFSTYDGKSWSKATRLNKFINTKYWESQASISDDGRTLVFSSDRPGGFGGLDLYISVRTSGDWGPAVNMGPEVNTPFNEDRPFIVNNGKTLFFSSQGHDNLGGYDIFRTELQNSQIWGKPSNIGYPLNTPDDNYFFSPSGNGSMMYYSIFRETGGFGKEDIYRIMFK
jgi:hypothetical protein